MRAANERRSIRQRFRWMEKTMKTYRIHTKTKNAAWRVLQEPSRYTAKTVRDAAMIVEHYEEGASYSRKPAPFRPIRKK